MLVGTMIIGTIGTVMVVSKIRAIVHRQAVADAVLRVVVKAVVGMEILTGLVLAVDAEQVAVDAPEANGRVRRSAQEQTRSGGGGVCTVQVANNAEQPS